MQGPDLYSHLSLGEYVICALIELLTLRRAAAVDLASWAALPLLPLGPASASSEQSSVS
jgi:hypothetical protein